MNEEDAINEISEKFNRSHNNNQQLCHLMQQTMRKLLYKEVKPILLTEDLIKKLRSQGVKI